VPSISHPLFNPSHPGRNPALQAAKAEQQDQVVHGPGEQVVLVDDDGTAIGVAPKASVHGATTPRHLAFSCYGFDAGGRLLMTRRADDKATFPAVWTNTCCGHPAPGEELADAAARRLRFELGLTVRDMQLALPDFSYRASDGRIEENEFCPVLICRIVGEPTPRPDEVGETAWWDWEHFLQAAADPASGLSPWSRLQAPLLDEVLFPNG
jgi:isopentenyl-diphosphate delta-isomerase